MRRNAWRYSLCLLPAALMLASSLELAASAFAWGAAEHVEIPAWETTFVGVCFGVPVLTLAVISLRETVRRTRTDFEVSLLLLFGGVFMMLFAIAVEAGLALRIADPATYDTIRNNDGTLNTSPSGFLYVGVFAAVLLALLVALPAYLFPQSMSVANRRPERSGEVDAIAEMLRGRHG